MTLSVVVKRVASTRAVALREVVANYQSQGPLWARTMQFAYGNQLAPLPESTAAFAIFHDQGFKESDVDTEVCVPIGSTADVKADGGLAIYDVPALERAASVTHKGSYKGLPAVYGQLFGWLAVQGEAINGPVREVYHVGAMSAPGQPNDEDEFVTELLVPLK